MSVSGVSSVYRCSVPVSQRRAGLVEANGGGGAVCAVERREEGRRGRETAHCRATERTGYTLFGKFD